MDLNWNMVFRSASVASFFFTSWHPKEEVFAAREPGNQGQEMSE